MEEVEISIDLKRREELRRLHTATHIINFSARKVLGKHIWQNGSNLKPEYGTLDITHYEGLTLKQTFEIEKLANKTVLENKSVKIETLSREKAEEKYGFTLYQGGAIPMKNLRIVSVEDNDIEACGGLHMEKTLKIGLIKIIQCQKIQDGVIRLKYVVNNYAREFVENIQESFSKIEELYGVKEDLVLKTSKKFFDDWKLQKKEISNLKTSLIKTNIELILSKGVVEFDLNENFEMGALLEIFLAVLKEKSSFKLINTRFIIATTNFEIENYKKKISKSKFNIFVL